MFNTQKGGINECLASMRESFSVARYPEDFWSEERKLGGGKSGAKISIVKSKDDQRTAILKIYESETYNPRDRDSRPLREIYTACVMSGTEGFPEVYDYGLTVTYEGILCLYLISQIVPGISMNELDMTQLTTQQNASILLQLLNILYKAKTKLGGVGQLFLHNDLHPGNIFIDTSLVSSERINFGHFDRGFQIIGPKVTVIDFDLAVSDRYRENISSRKDAKNILLPEAVMSWMLKYVGYTEDIEDIITKAAVAETEDLAIWNVYYMVSLILNWKRGNGGEITEQKIKEIIRDADVCQNTRQCYLHPYINQIMREHPEQYGEQRILFNQAQEGKGGLEDFGQRLKQIMPDGSIVAMINTCLGKIGLQAMSRTIFEKFLILDRQYYNTYKEHVPPKEIRIKIIIKPLLDQIHNIILKECLVGETTGEIYLDLLFKQYIEITVDLNDFKLKINFNSGEGGETRGLYITDIDIGKYERDDLYYGDVEFYNPLINIIKDILNPSINSITIKDSSKKMNVKDLDLDITLDYITRFNLPSVEMKQQKTDYKKLLRDIQICFLPLLFKTRGIFRDDIICQVSTLKHNIKRRNADGSMETITHQAFNGEKFHLSLRQVIEAGIRINENQMFQAQQAIVRQYFERVEQQAHAPVENIRQLQRIGRIGAQIGGQIRPRAQLLARRGLSDEQIRDIRGGIEQVRRPIREGIEQFDRGIHGIEQAARPVRYPISEEIRRRRIRTFQADDRKPQAARNPQY